MIRVTHDPSPVSVVTTCSECPWWRALSLSREAADDCKINHLVMVHDIEPNIAADFIRKRATRRHAAKRVSG